MTMSSGVARESAVPQSQGWLFVGPPGTRSAFKAGATVLPLLVAGGEPRTGVIQIEHHEAAAARPGERARFPPSTYVLVTTLALIAVITLTPASAPAPASPQAPVLPESPGAGRRQVLG